MSKTFTAMNRRQFTVEGILALLAGVTITVTGCGSDSSSSSPTAPTSTPPVMMPPGSAQQDVSGAISGNHGHIATVTGAQITGPNSVTVNIQGTATHAHNITLTGAQLQAIGARQRVAVASTNDAGHDHTVTFN
jgi:hypothetical protein